MKKIFSPSFDERIEELEAIKRSYSDILEYARHSNDHDRCAGIIEDISDINDQIIEVQKERAIYCNNII